MFSLKIGFSRAKGPKMHAEVLILKLRLQEDL